MEEVNKLVPAGRQLEVALINGPRNVIVAGPEDSLCGLNRMLRCDEDESQVGFQVEASLCVDLGLDTRRTLKLKGFLSTGKELIPVLSCSALFRSQACPCPLYHPT